MVMESMIRMGAAVRLSWCLDIIAESVLHCGGCSVGRDKWYTGIFQQLFCKHGQACRRCCGSTSSQLLGLRSVCIQRHM